MKMMSVLGLALITAVLSACEGGGSGGADGGSGFKSTDEVAAALAEARFFIDNDHVDAITPGPSGLTYPSSSACDGGGTVSTTADESTAFTGDGRVQAVNCKSTAGEPFLLNGVLTTKCVAPDQTTTTCGPYNEIVELVLGTATSALETVDRAGYASKFYGFSLKPTSSATDDYLLSYNGKFETRFSKAATPTFAFELNNFIGGYIDDPSEQEAVVFNGAFTGTSNASNCFNGRVTFKTNAAMLRNSSGNLTAGSVDITDAFGQIGKIEVNTDGTNRLRVSLNGVSKFYTEESIDSLCGKLDSAGD